MGEKCLPFQGPPQPSLHPTSRIMLSFCRVNTDRTMVTSAPVAMEAAAGWVLAKRVFFSMGLSVLSGSLMRRRGLQGDAAGGVVHLDPAGLWVLGGYS